MQRLLRYNQTTSALMLINSKRSVKSKKSLFSNHVYRKHSLFLVLLIASQIPSQASGFEWKEKMKGPLFRQGAMLRQGAELATCVHGKLVGRDDDSLS